MERIERFGGKLYLEMGGKLFDDYHAARVLPGFLPHSKMDMLLTLRAQVEVVIVINADDIEKNKVRGDLGITYDADVLRLIDAFRAIDLTVGSVVLTRFAGQMHAAAFRRRLSNWVSGFTCIIPFQWSVGHTTDYQRKRIWQKRLHRNHPSAGAGDSARPWQR